MPRLPLSVLAIACSVSLTACSSGGNSNASSNTTLLTNPAVTFAKTPTQIKAEEAKAEREKRAKEQAEAKAEQEKQAQQQAEAQAKTEQEKQAQQQAETQAKAEQEKQAQQQAETQAKAEQEKQAQQQAETQAKAEQEKQAQQQAETQAKAEQEKQAEQQAEAQAKAEQEKQAQQQAEAQAKAEQEKQIKEQQETIRQQAFAKSVQENTAGLSGTMLTLTDDVSLSAPSSQELEQLVVEGKTIPLYTTEERNVVENSNTLKAIKGDGFSGYVGSYISAKTGSGKVKEMIYYQDMRYGVYANANNVSTLFVQGNLSPVDETEKNANRVPTQKVYTYEGNALYGKDGSYTQLTTVATANFNDDVKKIKVELSEPNANSPKLTFGGDISGNTFSGKDSEGIVMSGAFYGDRGRNVGGVFYQTEGNEKGYNGVFGASSPKEYKGIQKKSENDKVSATDY